VDKKVIVTGCSGFIGYNLASNLLNKDYEVIGIDSLNNAYDVNLKKFRLSKLESNKNLKFLNIDLSNNNSYEELETIDIKLKKIAEIFHLALVDSSLFLTKLAENKN